MKSILLFTLIVTVTATNLRQEDAPLFRTPPQEAKVERHVETSNECTVCQYITAVMQKTKSRRTGRSINTRNSKSSRRWVDTLVTGIFTIRGRRNNASRLL